MSILIIDRRPAFCEVIELTSVTKSYGADYIAVSSMSGLDHTIRAKHVQLAVISQNILETAADEVSRIRVPITGFCQDEGGESIFRKMDIPCLGIVTDPGDLLDRIEQTEEGSGTWDRVSLHAMKEEGSASCIDRNYEKEDIPGDAFSNMHADAGNDRYEKPKGSGFSPEAFDEEGDRAAATMPDIHEKKDQDDPEIEKDLKKLRSRKTKVIAVCSPKGGVGKTALSCEIAQFLSMVWDGKKQMKVCLVDFDVRFGDVRTTLRVSTQKSLSLWTDDIRNRIKETGSGDTVRYSKEEIKDYLSIDKRTGLCFLPAPVTSEDASFIEEEELSVVLNSLIRDGGFDYIICDTAGSLEDASVLSASLADTVLLVLDQDINTANCSMSYLNGMKAAGFGIEPDRLKIVINRIMPEKTTNISVSDLLEAFEEYECVGKLSFSPDVIRAVNKGAAVCFEKPDSEFTRQLRKITGFLLGRKEESKEIRKPGRLGAIFGRKGR